MYTYLILCGLTGEPIMPCGRGLRGFRLLPWNAHPCLS